ncbi:spore gernimation protein GerPD [Aquibacillus rhizosphaerae]|uniref:Spore gernimation protein GerPD n=1 Tax=Aquibacillus rhizosphaerae TaxID=3051431 RepID=A0ABT7LAH9_9BACI|nr:spore gernimation protein GerPD [Aquibacillus sp. LR5S19]MDL4842868.1 spore gernimation protein GerPD [Aquibacillus sp. LR5S19]
MNYEVHNWDLHVGNVEITGVSSSSVFLIGDNESISLTSMYDTPPDSYIVGGSLVPLSRSKQEDDSHE